ncbi:hypothetical protein [Streptomyces sp. NPDC002845]
MERPTVPLAMTPQGVAQAGLGGLRPGETVRVPGPEDRAAALDALLAAETALLTGGTARPPPAATTNRPLAEDGFRGRTCVSSPSRSITRSLKSEGATSRTYTLHTRLIGPGTGPDNPATATPAEQRVTVGGTAGITVSWRDLPTGHTCLGLIGYDDGTDTVGTTGLTVTP